MFTLKQKHKKQQSANLARTIAMCRQSLGVSQSELSMRVGMSERRLVNIESCSAAPSVFDLMAFAIVFELSLSELLDIANMEAIASTNSDALAH